jgi:hypothetical protein
MMILLMMILSELCQTDENSSGQSLKLIISYLFFSVLEGYNGTVFAYGQVSTCIDLANHLSYALFKHSRPNCDPPAQNQSFESNLRK